MGIGMAELAAMDDNRAYCKGSAYVSDELCRLQPPRCDTTTTTTTTLKLRLGHESTYDYVDVVAGARVPHGGKIERKKKEN